MNEKELETDEPLTGEVMDVEGVALYLGLAPSNVYDKVQNLDIPHTRLGNLLRFLKRDIDEWLSENSVRPRPSLQVALAQAAQKFFITNWLKSVGLNPDNIDREKAVKRFQESLDLVVFDGQDEE